MTLDKNAVHTDNLQASKMDSKCYLCFTITPLNGVTYYTHHTRIGNTFRFHFYRVWSLNRSQFFHKQRFALIEKLFCTFHIRMSAKQQWNNKFGKGNSLSLYDLPLHNIWQLSILLCFWHSMKNTLTHLLYVFTHVRFTHQRRVWNESHDFNARASMYVCVCVCESKRACVCKGERERERKTFVYIHTYTHTHPCIGIRIQTVELEPANSHTCTNFDIVWLCCFYAYAHTCVPRIHSALWQCVFVCNLVYTHVLTLSACTHLAM